MIARPDSVPLITIVTPVCDPPVGMLREAVDSVIAQTFDDWELILVDDCSPNPRVQAVLREYAALDPRITLVERQEIGHIARALNDGLAAARGDFIALLEHDDTLAPTALADNAAVIADHDDVDFIYSDEDRIRGGVLLDPVRKPVWSPERLRSQNYCNHFSVLRADLVRKVGGFREGFEGAHDYDLVLRVTERARRIVHIPQVLYHWRAPDGSARSEGVAGPHPVEAGRKAVQEHLDRVGIDATVSVNPSLTYRIHRTLPAERVVSIVIPTIGSSSLVWGRQRTLVVESVRSALAHTTHERVEIVVVYDEPTPPAVLDRLREIAGSRLVLVPFREKFNYSRKINLGVLASRGERLVVLNDDVEVRTHEWLDELVAPLEEPDVGLTGAKLLFSSSAIQHAGLAFSHGTYHHPYRRTPSDLPGQFEMLVVNREVSGVTGACVALRRDTFVEVGGLAEGLPESFNDVDFCYKILRAGYRVLYLANCELFHFESQTRDPVRNPADTRFMRHRWGVPVRDPYTPVSPDPPRRHKYAPSHARVAGPE